MKLGEMIPGPHSICPVTLTRPAVKMFSSEMRPQRKRKDAELEMAQKRIYKRRYDSQIRSDIRPGISPGPSRQSCWIVQGAAMIMER